MKRRTFIAGLGGATVWPFIAQAQQRQVPVVGFLSGRSPDEAVKLVEAFRRGLTEAGYHEGSNVVILYRWADGQYDHLPALAAELVAHLVNIIVSAGGSSLAVKGATTKIPVVFTEGRDPVASGLVQSLNRPGGNMTGVVMLNKCKKDACEPKAVGSDGKPLVGAAKSSFLKKCQKDA